MSPHQMICHLRDAFLMGTEQKPVSRVTGLHRRTVVKWVALYLPARWPPGLRTRPEIDQAVGGTKPANFQADVESLEAVIDDLLVDPPAFFGGRDHPIFGALSTVQWLRWGYLHMDHHLRQFGA